MRLNIGKIFFPRVFLLSTEINILMLSWDFRKSEFPKVVSGRWAFGDLRNYTIQVQTSLSGIFISKEAQDCNVKIQYCGRRLKVTLKTPSQQKVVFNLLSSLPRLHNCL